MKAPYVGPHKDNRLAVQNGSEKQSQKHMESCLESEER